MHETSDKALPGGVYLGQAYPAPAGSEAGAVQLLGRRLCAYVEGRTEMTSLIAAVTEMEAHGHSDARQ